MDRSHTFEEDTGGTLNRSHLIGVVFFFAVVAALWGASHWGALATLDGLLYDGLTRWAWIGDPPAPRTLLVESLDQVPPPSEEELAAVVQSLYDMDAAAVGVTDGGFQDHGKALARGDGSQRLLVVRVLRADPHRPGGFLATSPPIDAPARLAGLAAPRLEAGIGRSSAVSYALPDGDLPAVAWELAKELAAGDSPALRLPRTEYRLDFSAATANLPWVSFERASSGGLVPELVAGKAVLIAIGQAAAPGIATPRGGEPLSLSRYTVVALETLLQGRWIRTLSAPLELLLIAVAAALAIPLFLLAAPRAVPLLLLGSILLVGLLAWVSLSWFRVWVPIAAPILALAAAYLFTAWRRWMINEQRLHNEVLNGAARLDRSRLLDEFYASPEHWSALAVLVTQLLDLKRTIFFETLDGDHRVREVESLHCSFDEIQERRRDFTRSPYTDAIAKNGPLELAKDFLDHREGEVQYLVPLTLAGQVFGFWAFAVTPLKGLERTRLLTVAADLGVEASELLYRRRRWQMQEQRRQRLWPRLLRLDPQEDTPRLVHTTFARLQRRLDVLEGVIDGIETAVVLYDLFGRVVQVNRRMADQLVKAGLVPFDTTVVDLVATLAHRPPEQVRRDLRGLILERKAIGLTITLGEPANVYFLSVRPLAADAGKEARPFELFGFLVELLNVHEVREVFRLKDQLALKIGAHYRDAIQAVLLSGSLLENRQLGTERRDEVLGIMRKKLEQIVNFSHRVEELLSTDPGTPGTELYPMSLLEALEAAVASVEPLRRERKVELHRQQPRLDSLVFASPAGLRPLLENLLRLMILDCMDGGAVSLSVSSDVGSVHLACSNTGLGLPDERLQEYLQGTEVLESEELRTLREGVRLVGLWGGTLTLHSKIGDGLRASLELRAFA